MVRFNPRDTRPWSLAGTPIIPNPRRLPEISDRMVDLATVMERSTPWRYLDSGFVIWEGPSPVDGAPLVAIATGVQESGNIKTGSMLQTWIMRADISPQAAVDSGGDASICGHCKHRGFELDEPKTIKKRKTITAKQAAKGWGIAGGHPATTRSVKAVMGGRTCYVVVAQAPMAIWKAYHRGIYPRMSEQEIPLLGYGRIVRLGSYGDPAMVPTRVWRSLCWDSMGWTGYTHQWCDPNVQDLRPFVMASVDNEQELEKARAMGWRTFRVLRGDQQLVAGVEVVCPASAEAGHLKTCDACRLCRGAMPGKPRHELPPEEKWRERSAVPGIGIKVHPRWQVLYYARGKKGKRLRGFTPDTPPTKLRPAKKPSEVVLVDYLAGSEVKPLLKALRRAEKSRDLEGALAEIRADYPDYLQSYFDQMPELMRPRGRKPSSNPYDLNPTKAEDLLAKAIRPCMTREEAHHAASSIERSLAAVQRHKTIPERTRAKIVKLADQGRGAKTPNARIRALAAANRSLQQLRTYGAGSKRPSKGYKKKRRERTDPRLGHMLHGPALGEEAMRRRRAFEAEWEIAANPRALHELKELELDDAKYFNKAAPVIAELQAQVNSLREELAEAEEALPEEIEKSMRRTRYDIQRDEARRRFYRSNPLLAVVGNPPRRARPEGQERARCGNVRCARPRDEWVYRNVHQGGQAWFCSPACHDDHVATGELRRGSRWRQPRVRNNPLLAIVGNPGSHPREQRVDPRAFMARDRYREDMAAGHDDAAEYWRGQAGAYFTANPRGRKSELKRHRNEAMRLIHEAVEHHDFDALHEAHEHVRAAFGCCTNPPNPEDAGVLDDVLAEIEGAEAAMIAELYKGAGKSRGKRRKAVAGSGKGGRVKGKRKGKVQKNFKAKKPAKFKAPRKKRYSLEEARKKFKGFDKALKAYRRFHDREPGHVDVYELDDGESVVTVDDVHAALHRTLETNYLVPWDSNKKGSYWKHEHLEGAMEGKVNPLDRVEDLPLEVFDVKRNRTIKLPNGRWYVTDWWRERGGRGERRRH
jgi:hypothetical protein